MKKSKKTTSKKDKVTQVISVFGLVLQVGRLGTILRIGELSTWDEQRRPPKYIKDDIYSFGETRFLLFSFPFKQPRYLFQRNPSLRL